MKVKNFDTWLKGATRTDYVRVLFDLVDVRCPWVDVDDEQILRVVELEKLDDVRRPTSNKIGRAHV